MQSTKRSFVQSFTLKDFSQKISLEKLRQHHKQKFFILGVKKCFCTLVYRLTAASSGGDHSRVHNIPFRIKNVNIQVMDQSIQQEMLMINSQNHVEQTLFTNRTPINHSREVENSKFVLNNIPTTQFYYIDTQNVEVYSQAENLQQGDSLDLTKDNEVLLSFEQKQDLQINVEVVLDENITSQNQNFQPIITVGQQKKLNEITNDYQPFIDFDIVMYVRNY